LDLGIPLVFLEASERVELAPIIVKFARGDGVSHVIANYESGADELRRDIKVLKAASQTR